MLLVALGDSSLTSTTMVSSLPPHSSFHSRACVVRNWATQMLGAGAGAGAGAGGRRVDSGRSSSDESEASELWAFRAGNPSRVWPYKTHRRSAFSGGRGRLPVALARGRSSTVASAPTRLCGTLSMRGAREWVAELAASIFCQRAALTLRVANAQDASLRVPPDTGGGRAGGGGGGGKVWWHACTLSELKLAPFKRAHSARTRKPMASRACENALVWLENAWLQEGRDDQWPEDRLVAQTTLGPAEAACAFAAAFLSEGEAELVHDRVMRRKQKRTGEFLTFRAEFLHVASMLREPLLLLVVGQGGVVRSVELCAPGEAPRVVNQDEAREAFDSTLAVVIDFESTRTVAAYTWSTCWKTLTLREGVAVAPTASTEQPTGNGPTPLAGAEMAPWSGGEETKRRIERAKRALRDRTLW